METKVFTPNVTESKGPLILQVMAIANFMELEGQFEDWCGCNILMKHEGFIAEIEEHNHYMHPYNPNEDWGQLMPAWIKLMQWGISEFGIYWKQEITDSAVQISTTKSKKYDYCWLIFKGGLSAKQVFNALVDCLKWREQYLSKINL